MGNKKQKLQNIIILLHTISNISIVASFIITLMIWVFINLLASSFLGSSLSGFVKGLTNGLKILINPMCATTLVCVALNIFILVLNKKEHISSETVQAFLAVNILLNMILNICITKSWIEDASIAYTRLHMHQIMIVVDLLLMILCMVYYCITDNNEDGMVIQGESTESNNTAE